MTRLRSLLALPAALALALVIGGPAAAHNEAGSGIFVEPGTCQAGDTVMLAGKGLEANSDRVLTLAGPDTILDLGTVTTDADGMFQKEITIPAHLPAGIYEFRATADETMTVQVSITAAPGMTTVAATGTKADDMVQPYALSTAVLAAVGIVAAVVFIVGFALARGAERFGHRPEPVAAE